MDDPKQNEWKRVIEEELVALHILNENHKDPRKALNDVIDWHVQIALDVAVSTDAQKLFESGREFERAKQKQPLLGRLTEILTAVMVGVVAALAVCWFAV